MERQGTKVTNKITEKYFVMQTLSMEAKSSENLQDDATVLESSVRICPLLQRLNIVFLRFKYLILSSGVPLISIKDE